MIRIPKFQNYSTPTDLEIEGDWMQADGNGHRDKSEIHSECLERLVEKVTEIGCNSIVSERSSKELVKSVGCNKPAKDS
jgi:hypothetical protein